MTALEHLEQVAQFLVDHGHLQAMRTIAESPLFADDQNRCAAMYGFAQGIGLTESDGLDPAWLPFLL